MPPDTTQSRSISKHTMKARLVELSIAFFLGSLPVVAATPEDIESDITNLLSLHGKVSIQTRRSCFEKVVAHREDAVPALIHRYGTSGAVDKPPIVECLCAIATDKSLAFVTDILRRHEDKYATWCAIRCYPVEREAEITPTLVSLLAVQDYGWNAQERLLEIMRRKPRQAEALVKALRDEAGLEKVDYSIWDVLQQVSGYGYEWGGWSPPGTNPLAYRKTFWKEWWERNKDRQFFDWQVEALPRAQALQNMGALKDRKAIPYFLKALDSPSQGVRYWAVIGLQKLDGTHNPSGYIFEKYVAEERVVIERLRKKYNDQVQPIVATQTSAPVNADTPHP